MARIFSKFEEIETELENQAPPIVYKYRSWKSDSHKSLLKNRQAWFSHPFDLNDPLDVRPETEFDFAEFKEPAYYQKMFKAGIEMFPTLSLAEVEEKAKAQWELIKQQPNIVVQNLKNHSETRQNYDVHGVFSVGKSGLNEKLWEEYGDKHAGYTIGFKTIEFCRGVKSGYGHVIYSDKPYRYSFLSDNDDNKMSRLYMKKEKWGFEDEFRFITVGVGRTSQRTQTFAVETVAEIVLGYAISPEDEKEILEIVEKNYPKDLPVYKTQRDSSGRLTKVKVR